MTTDNPITAAAGADAWRGVDEGWGRRAVEFATLSEPANCREYVALHEQLGISAGDRLLDVACGAGLALELAALRGASCAGIDASPRLVAVARDRVPEADLRVGDMHAMPWADASFDVVTSFRGIWGTTPDAVAEVRRVLAPGGRMGLTVWGHIKASPGAWALAPFRLASRPQVENQAAMVALGRPGAGEELLTRSGFVDVRRVDIPFVWEFADPESYARALASTGPAYEAIQTVGEEEFLRTATEVARDRVRDGLPLRAPIAVVGYVASRPAATPSRRSSGAGEQGAGERAASEQAASEQAVSAPSFLAEPETTPEVEALYADDVDDLGFVMNVSRLWGHGIAQERALFELMGQSVGLAGLSLADRGVLVSATASSFGDSYCALAWGRRLAGEVGADVAADVLAGDDSGLDPRQAALARWARRVVRDPNATVATDLDELRSVGYGDAEILAVTLYVGLRVAFAMVNESLGARPDVELLGTVPVAVRDAVTWGRPPATGTI